MRSLRGALSRPPQSRGLTRIVLQVTLIRGRSNRLEPDQGNAGLVGLLVTLGAAGALGIALLAMNARTPNAKSRAHVPAVDGQSIQASPGAAAPDIAAATIEECRADVAIVVEAVSEYETLRGLPPKAMTDLSDVLKNTITSSRFTILIDPRHPGQVDVSTPGHAPAGGDADCAYA